MVNINTLRHSFLAFTGSGPVQGRLKTPSASRELTQCEAQGR